MRKKREMDSGGCECRKFRAWLWDTGAEAVLEGFRSHHVCVELFVKSRGLLLYPKRRSVPLAA